MSFINIITIINLSLKKLMYIINKYSTFVFSKLSLLQAVACVSPWGIL